MFGYIFLSFSFIFNQIDDPIDPIFSYVNVVSHDARKSIDFENKVKILKIKLIKISHGHTSCTATLIRIDMIPLKN